MLAATLVLTLVAAPQDHERRASPFDAIRWEEDRPVVQVEAAWYRPISIDGLAVDEILEVCRARWPGQVQKRFSEDLMEAMFLLDAEPGPRVTLELERTTDGQVVELADVPNTADKRNRLRDANKGPNRAVPKTTLTEAEVAEDLRAFEIGLRERFAYLRLREVAWEESLAEIERDLAPGVAAARLADRLERVMMRFGDGHASVRAPRDRSSRQGPYLPFLVADSSAGPVAFTADRRGFVDPQRPVVRSLGGFSLEACLEAVRPLVVDGSPQTVRDRSLGLLRDVSLWYPVLTGEEAPLQLAVELAPHVDGEATEVRIGLVERKPTFGTWPRSESERIGEIGYLRLPSMNDAAVEEVHRWMPRFEDTRGLIIDVRGNGGGSRAALLALAGYLVEPDGGPWVGNVAAYRLAEAFDEDHLDARYMYRADHPGWTDEQRAAIAEAQASFEPEWELPEGFSEWHYLVLDRTGHPSEYAYPAPVVILSDAGCFSATDIFLGALELHDRVTILGTASGGGSARSQSFLLPHSQIEVRCASMASFRPNGLLYDGRGIEVDVEVLPAPAYFLEDGEDAQMEAALRLLLE